MKMNRKRLRKFINQNYDQIKEEILKAYQDMEDCMQGTTSDVCIDLYTGEIYHTDALTQNTMPMEVWNGDSIVVASIPAWKVGWDGFDYIFEESFQHHDKYEEVIVEYKRVEEDYCDLYDFVSERYPEIIEELDAEMREILLDERFPIDADIQINEFLYTLEQEERLEREYMDY